MEWVEAGVRTKAAGISGQRKSAIVIMQIWVVNGIKIRGILKVAGVKSLDVGVIMTMNHALAQL